MKCPHCNGNIDVRFVKAPPDMQSGAVRSQSAAVGDMGELLDQCSGQPMTTWEETFVSEQLERYVKYKDRTKVSDKQLAILRKIANGEGGRSREEEF